MDVYTLGSFIARSEVKLGDGFDVQMYYVSKRVGEPENVTTQYNKSAHIGIMPFSSSEPVVYSLGGLVEDQVLKLIDFCVVLDDQDYLKLSLNALTKVMTCTGCTEYPNNTNYYINRVCYGMALDIILPAAQFSDTRVLDKALANVDNLSSVQKNQKCKMLINRTEVREMKLEDIYKFKDEFLNGQHSEYEAPVTFTIEKINNYRPIIINNAKFDMYLYGLYNIYRKIEMKLEQNGFETLETPSCSNEKGEQIVENLKKAKEALRQAPKDDYLKFYQAMKECFFRYRRYLKLVIHNRKSIDEADDLPIPLEHLPILFTGINNWNPKK